MITLPPSVEPLFAKAGWIVGRRVEVPDGIPSNHPAIEILSAFGGLRVGSCDAGEDYAMSDLLFTQVLDEDGYVGVWENLLGESLVGIALVHRLHGSLFVGSSGRCFGKSEVHDAFYFEGPSFAAAIERILLGRRSQPMLRPDQNCVRLYGQEFRSSSPELYDYQRR